MLADGTPRHDSCHLVWKVTEVGGPCPRCWINAHSGRAVTFYELLFSDMERNDASVYRGAAIGRAGMFTSTSGKLVNGLARHRVRGAMVGPRNA